MVLGLDMPPEKQMVSDRQMGPLQRGLFSCLLSLNLKLSPLGVIGGRRTDSVAVPLGLSVVQERTRSRSNRDIGGRVREQVSLWVLRRSSGV